MFKRKKIFTKHVSFIDYIINLDNDYEKTELIYQARKKADELIQTNQAEEFEIALKNYPKDALYHCNGRLNLVWNEMMDVDCSYHPIANYREHLLNLLTWFYSREYIKPEVDFKTMFDLVFPSRAIYDGPFIVRYNKLEESELSDHPYNSSFLNEAFCSIIIETREINLKKYSFLYRLLSYKTISYYLLDAKYNNKLYDEQHIWENKNFGSYLIDELIYLNI